MGRYLVSPQQTFIPISLGRWVTQGTSAMYEGETWPAQRGRPRGGYVSSTLDCGCVGPRAANLIAAKPCYRIPAQDVI